MPAVPDVAGAAVPSVHDCIAAGRSPRGVDLPPDESIGAFVLRRAPGRVTHTSTIARMLFRLLLLFVLLPIVELALLIRIGNWLGFWPTMALVLFTGFVGAVLARSQGAYVLGQIRTELSVGRVPAARLVDGLLVLVGGTLLLTPGLITDLVGFALLLPFSRARLKAAVQRRFERMVRSGEVGVITLIR